jgi:hypothetical protein
MVTTQSNIIARPSSLFWFLNSEHGANIKRDRLLYTDYVYGCVFIDGFGGCAGPFGKEMEWGGGHFNIKFARVVCMCGAIVDPHVNNCLYAVPNLGVFIYRWSCRD